MLFIYDKAKKILTRIEDTSLFRTGTILKRRDIEGWVLENPIVLGEKLLILSNEIGSEYKSDKKLDLLAMDHQGALVVVDLNCENDGWIANLQAIQNAAQCSAMTLSDIVNLHQQYLAKSGDIVDFDSVESRIRAFPDNDVLDLSRKPRVLLFSRYFKQLIITSVVWLRSFGVDVRCVRLAVHELDSKRIFFDTIPLVPGPDHLDSMASGVKAGGP